MTVAVMGATGRTGKKITNLLLHAGEKVRVLGRSESKLAELRNAGAEEFTGAATDVAFLMRAFRGTDAVYTLLPHEPETTDYFATQNEQGEAIATALRESGTGHVVFLSSVGAELASGNGPIASLHAQERRLRGIEGTNVLFLRAGALFENFYASLAFIKEQAMIGDVYAHDTKIPMIAAQDVAEVAAQALIARNWEGTVVRELLGPQDLTYAEATRIIGERIGKPDLEYVQFSSQDMAAALVQAGFSPNVAGLYVELAEAINENRVKPLAGRTSENTTPTRFTDFADELVHAYEST